MVSPFRPSSHGLFLAFGILGISHGAIFARLADAPAVVTACYRVSFAALIILPFVFQSKRSRCSFKKMKTGDCLAAIGAGIFLAGHFAFWISSLDHTSIASSVILVNTAPLWIVVLSFFIGRERPDRATIFNVGLALLGVCLISIFSHHISEHGLRGDLSALIGGAFMGLYLMAGRFVRKTLDWMPYLLICYGVAAVTLWIWIFLSNTPFLGFSKLTWISFLAMAVLSQVLGHGSYNWALRSLRAEAVALCLLGEPVLSPLLGYLYFREGIPISVLAGAPFILFALYRSVFLLPPPQGKKSVNVQISKY